MDENLYVGWVIMIGQVSLACSAAFVAWSCVGWAVESITTRWRAR